MKTRWKLVLACSVCMTLAGCNPPSSDQRDAEDTEAKVAAEAQDGGEGPKEPVPAKQDEAPDFVGALWKRNVDIAKPCENAAAVLADRIAFTSPQNAKPEAQKGLKLCENALAKQNALQVPEEADGDLAITLDAAIHQCREALDARRKFFESSIMVLDGDTSRWRTGMVETSSMMAKGRSDDCIALFREAGLEI